MGGQDGAVLAPCVAPRLGRRVGLWGVAVSVSVPSRGVRSGGCVCASWSPVANPVSIEVECVSMHLMMAYTQPMLFCEA